MVTTTSACRDNAEAEEVGFQTQPQKAYTWAEWVERETPKRHGYEPYYFSGKGPPPNMSLWQPEDFLPQEYLDAEHKDVCELPLEERDKVRNAVRMAYTPEDVAERLALAKAGYAEAQAGMGPFCYTNDLNSVAPGLGLTTMDALEWARRGAASGKPDAMYRLADCMYAMSLDHSDGLVEIDDPFWTDQIIYWLWQATETLQGDALTAMRPTIGWGRFSYPDREANLIEAYKWSRLWELQAIFRRGPERLGPLHMAFGVDMELHADSFDPQQMQQAEATVAEWLNAHPGIWDRIYHTPALDIGVNVAVWREENLSCPGEPSYRKSFDYAGLNRELANYGLSAAPPSE